MQQAAAVDERAIVGRGEIRDPGKNRGVTFNIACGRFAVARVLRPFRANSPLGAPDRG